MVSISNPGWARKHFSNRNKPKDQITILSKPGPAEDYTYTGAGPDGVVQPDMPVMIDKMAAHEGEGIIPADEVAAVGGPTGVREAMEKQKQMKTATEMPSVRGFQTGIDEIPPKDIAADHYASKATAIMPPPKDIAADHYASKAVPQDIAAGNYASKTASQDIAAGHYASKAAPKDIAADHYASKAVPQDIAAGHYAAKAAAVDMPAVQTQTDTDRADMNARRAAGDFTAVGETAQDYTPEQVSARNALSKKLGRGLTDEETQRLLTSNATELEQWLLDEGLIPSRKTTGQMPEVGPGGVAGDMLQRTVDLATGNSDAMRRIANIAFSQLDGRLQTQMTLMAMQIANNPNMTDGAKRAAMAQQLMANGVAQSDLAADMAGRAIDASIQATKDAYQMASLERAFGVEQKTNAMNTAREAGDIDGFVRIANELYGVDIDPSVLQSEKALNDLADGYMLANQIITQFGEDATLDTAGMRTALAKVWAAENPGVPMDDEWAADQVIALKKSQDPVHRMMAGMSNDWALTMFDGDQGKLDAFEFGGKTGIEAFRSAMSGFMTLSVVKMDDEGYMVFDEESPFYQAFLDTFSQGGADVDGAGTANSTTTTGTVMAPEALTLITELFTEGRVINGTIEGMDPVGLSMQDTLRTMGIDIQPDQTYTVETVDANGVVSITDSMGTKYTYDPATAELTTTPRTVTPVDMPGVASAGGTTEGTGGIAASAPGGAGSFAPTNLNTVLEGGSYSDPDGLLFFEEGDPITGFDDKNQLVATSKTTAKDPKTGDLYEIDAYGDFVLSQQMEYYGDDEETVLSLVGAPVVNIGGVDIYKGTDGRYVHHDIKGKVVDYTFKKYKEASPDNLQPDIVAGMITGGDTGALTHAKTMTATGNLSYLAQFKTTDPEYKKIAENVPKFETINDDGDKGFAPGKVYLLDDGTVVKITQPPVPVVDPMTDAQKALIATSRPSMRASVEASIIASNTHDTYTIIWVDPNNKETTTSWYWTGSKMTQR